MSHFGYLIVSETKKSYKVLNPVIKVSEVPVNFCAWSEIPCGGH